MDEPARPSPTDDLSRAQEDLGRALGRARIGEDRALANQVRELGERPAHLLSGLLRMTRALAGQRRLQQAGRGSRTWRSCARRAPRLRPPGGGRGPGLRERHPHPRRGQGLERAGAGRGAAAPQRGRHHLPPAPRRTGDPRPPAPSARRPRPRSRATSLARGLAAAGVGGVELPAGSASAWPTRGAESSDPRSCSPGPSPRPTRPSRTSRPGGCPTPSPCGAS